MPESDHLIGGYGSGRPADRSSSVPSGEPPDRFADDMFTETHFYSTPSRLVICRVCMLIGHSLIGEALKAVARSSSWEEALIVATTALREGGEDVPEQPRNFDDA